MAAPRKPQAPPMSATKKKSAPGKSATRRARAPDGGERSNRTFIEEARRRQILETALILFTERGYNRTSLADLASAIGVSKGVVSYHFHGKAELGRETLRHVLRRYRDFVRQRLDGKTSPRERLLELPAACLDFVRREPSYLVYLDTLGSFGTAAERQEFMARGIAGMRKLIVDLILAAQAAGEIAHFPPGPLADLIQAAVDGLMEQRALDPGAVDLEACKQLLLRMLVAVVDAP
jgi:TetR/AcrR family fatty acid metabolism transcriptional regulator